MEEHLDEEWKTVRQKSGNEPIFLELGPSHCRRAYLVARITGTGAESWSAYGDMLDSMGELAGLSKSPETRKVVSHHWEIVFREVIAGNLRVGVVTRLTFPLFKSLPFDIQILISRFVGPGHEAQMSFWVGYPASLEINSRYP